MRIAEFETVSPAIAACTLPCRIHQQSARLGPAILLALMIPLALVPLVPLATVALQLATDPTARAHLAAHPAATTQISLGLALVSLLIAWPMRALLGRIAHRRIVVIGQRELHVTDLGLFATRTWTRPLTHYLGLAHHVRTTHDGVRHELILVDPERRDSVLLALAPRMSDADVTALAGRLGVPIVPAEALYGRAARALWPSLPAAATPAFSPAKA